MNVFPEAPGFTMLTWILSSVVSATMVRASPIPVECTMMGAFRCFNSYNLILAHRDLHPNNQGQFNEVAFEEACRSISEKYACHDKFLKCPPAFVGNFSQQQKGYEAMRALLCDVPAHKDYQTSLACMDPYKIECDIAEIENMDTLDVQDATCRMIQIGVKCFESKYKSSCPLTMTKAKGAFMSVQKPWAMMAGCEDTIGAGEALQSSMRILLGTVAFSFLLWIYA
ncbi:uncharacterized protein LOC144139515 [Haemaphysalis longicornis]